MAKIAIDFDGTIVEDRYPDIGPEITFATDTLRMLQQEHHQLILWTVREGEALRRAVEWCHERGIDFWAVNSDYPEEKPSDRHYSRNIGGLLDWGQIYAIISQHKTLSDVLLHGTMVEKKKKHWWNF